MIARATGAVAAAALLLALATGCSAPAPDTDTDTSAPDGTTAPAASDDASAAAALVQQRYELVRDKNYEGACALYSDAFAEQFAELADAAGATCVEAHEKAAQNATDYLATAADQGRAGLTPFFHVPSAIEVDPTAITVDEPGVAFLGEGTVVSLDPTGFEDGTGLTPGWLAGQDYVKRGDDGSWHFITPLEQ